MVLPAITFPVVSGPRRIRPLRFPEIRFRAAGVVPPIVLFDTFSRKIPPIGFAVAAVPAALVPMKFPSSFTFDARDIRAMVLPLPDFPAA